MTNAKINQVFLDAADSKTNGEILESIAKAYGISAQEALTEVVGDEAEHLLDYLAEPLRSAVSVLMQRLAIATA